MLEQNAFTYFLKKRLKGIIKFDQHYILLDFKKNILQFIDRLGGKTIDFNWQVFGITALDLNGVHPTRCYNNQN